MRQKLITLCPNSFEIAQKKPNFSKWVRTKLLEEPFDLVKEDILYRYRCPLCTREELDVVRRARNCTKCDYAMQFKGEVVA